MLDESYDRIPILFEGTIKFVDPITRQTYDFASDIPCLGDYTNVLQLDLEIDNSWYQLLPDLMPFIKPLLFNPIEIGHITQIPNFDTKCAGMYTPKQLKIFWDNIIECLSFRHCPKEAYKDHSDTRQYSSNFQSWKLTTPFEST